MLNNQKQIYIKFSYFTHNQNFLKWSNSTTLTFLNLSNVPVFILILESYKDKKWDKSNSRNNHHIETFIQKMDINQCLVSINFL